MKMKIYGFTWKVSFYDKMERIAEFKAISEENAIKNFKRWIKKNELFEGEALGQLIKKTK